MNDKHYGSYGNGFIGLDIINLDRSIFDSKYFFFNLDNQSDRNLDGSFFDINFGSNNFDNQCEVRCFKNKKFENKNYFHPHPILSNLNYYNDYSEPS